MTDLIVTAFVTIKRESVVPARGGTTKRVDVLESLSLLGSQQYGLVTTSQAKDAGIPRIWLSRLARAGILQRLRQGVYALPSASNDALQELRAAWMAVAVKSGSDGPFGSDTPAAVISHSTAAMVHHLGDLIPSRFEFTSPALLQTSQPDIAFYRAELLPDEVSWLHGLPVTSVARTVSDLSNSYIDLDQLDEIIKNAYRQGVPKDELVLALDPRFDREGIADVRGFVDQAINTGPNETVTDSQRQKDLVLHFAERLDLTEGESKALLRELSIDTRDLISQRLDL